MSDELDAMGDAELDEVFAVEIAGWTFETFPNGALPQVKHWKRPGGIMTSIYTHGNFTKDANAVLPWLEKCSRWKAEQCSPDGVWVDLDTPTFGQAYGITFARSAAKALIRAKRAQKANT